MLVLMVVLIFLRRRSEAKDVTLWLVGLCFIFVEAIASDLYRFTSLFHAPSHSIALDSYVLAGLTFAWAARKDSVRPKAYLSFCLAMIVPLFAITTLYGLNLHQRYAYLSLVVTGIALGLACTVVFLRDVRLIGTVLAVQIVTWGPMFWLAGRSGYREMTYWGMGCLYMLVAVALWGVMTRSRIGGSVMVAGFVLWSLCLFTHPYVGGNPVIAVLNDEVWTLQKFFVTIGLLLVLLDEQSLRNRELALHDPLTGLPNRRLFDDRISQSIKRSARYRTRFAIFTIDLNSFKAVNDLLGHRRGDEVLCEAANCLNTVVRAADTLARCGGDEFTVIVNDVSNRQICDLIAGQLRSSLEGASTGLPFKLSGSVGYAMYPDDAVDSTLLQEIADRRMYENKHAVQGAAV
ncbi:MAG: diguanylate cyclase [Acidobacteriaceae bacterium]|nr:diguanylate cyclase [Acidobacteriaceae bacterium]